MTADTTRDAFGNNVRAPDGRQWTPYQFFIADYQVGKRWGAARRASQQTAQATPAKPEAPKIESFTDSEGRLVLRMQ